MGDAEYLLLNLYCAPVVLFGFRVLTLMAERIGKVVECYCDYGVILSKSILQDSDRPPEKSRGLFIAP